MHTLHVILWVSTLSGRSVRTLGSDHVQSMEILKLLSTRLLGSNPAANFGAIFLDLTKNPSQLLACHAQHPDKVCSLISGAMQFPGVE